jgi:RNA polymerase sigma-70 factor (ECF subfamily)
MTGGDYNLSSDILQESFTRCIERYNDRIESIALIYKIARNLVIDHNRKTCREERYKDQSAVDEKLIENQVLVKEQYQKVLLALKSLRFDDREFSV